ncbi:protein of unknown function [Modestobacter italicus]|uniref:Uncharacterized protein n=1 Tax=Modestobacter italicus (strain DSM 44449 / CECT 9708 / BC 501) TaxID=2732864 RepID=I4F0M5_MODI5|nr:hypothetical protein [Modestobacter marinus]CCH89188.1 protein of unknown function [Modestobacter marinus]
MVEFGELREATALYHRDADPSPQGSTGSPGAYLEDNDIAVLDDRGRALTSGSVPADANSALLNADDARRLWEVSEALLSKGKPSAAVDNGWFLCRSFHG